MSAIEPQRKSGSVMRAGHFVMVAAVAVIAIIVVFTVLSFVVGIVFEILKIAIVAAVVVAAFWLVSKYARRNR